MQNMPMMDDVDFALVNALQLHPRISWEALGAILRTDGSTLARRWRALREGGLVWTACYAVGAREWSTMPPLVSTLIEVDCDAGEREAVITALVEHPHVVSVECTSGSRDLMLTVAHPTIRSTDDYITRQLGRTPGVRATRTHVMRRVFKDGAAWALTALRESQRSAVLRTKGEMPDAPVKPGPLLWEVLAQLGEDVRRPASAIAEAIGRPPSSVTRAIAQLMHADWARTRIEIAHDRLGWNASTVLWLNLPHLEVDAFAANIATLSDIRFCASVVNRANVAFSLWQRDLGDLDRFEDQLSRLYPSAEVVDRWTIMRTAKRLGHVLTPEGLHSHYVAPEQNTPPAT